MTSMDGSERAQPGQAIVRRFLDRRHEAILAHGRFEALFSGYLDHARLWGVAPDPLAAVMMRQALGGAALYLSCRPVDETVAWTLNIRQPPLNLFFTGSAETGSITGRAFAEGVETAAMSRLYVDRRRRGGEHSQSTIDVEGHDVLLILEDYGKKSDQADARFFELADDEYLMVVSLPADEHGWLAALDREAAVRLLAHVRPLDEKTFWFHCGCDPEKMTATVKSMYEGRLDELFSGEEAIEIHCPRCGRQWRLGRDRFQAP